MNIYLIESIHAVDYDSFDSFCIIANSEEEVRKIAQENGADEIGWEEYAKEYWTDPLKTEVQLVGNYVGEKIEPFILISSFNAG